MCIQYTFLGILFHLQGMDSLCSTEGMDGWHPHAAMGQRDLPESYWWQEITVGDGHFQCTLLR